MYCRFRAALFAGVSTTALLIGSAQLNAADVPARVVTKAPVVAPCKPAHSIFVEGGAFWTHGGKVHHDPFFGDLDEGFDSSVMALDPRMGWYGAAGIDLQVGCSPWHVSTQFRYGVAGTSSKNFSSAFEDFSEEEFEEGFTSGDAQARARHHEKHWALDFMVGYQLGVGGAPGPGRHQSQLKVGVRVAKLDATTRSSGEATQNSSIPPITSIFEALEGSQLQKSAFLGFGPRVAFEGTAPLAGAWAVDYGIGAALLFGNRKLSNTGSGVLTTTFCSIGGCSPGIESIFSSSQRSTDRGTVFNLDAQLGLSYWMTDTFRWTVGYRFDGYWNALRTLNKNGTPANEDRFFHGAFLRVTGQY